MAYETKVILTLLAERIIMCKSIEEAYEAIRRAASVEGVQLLSYKQFLEQLNRGSGEEEQ